MEWTVAGAVAFAVGIVNGAIAVRLFIFWREIAAAKKMVALIRRAERRDPHFDWRTDDPLDWGPWSENDPADTLYVPEDW